MAEYLRRERFGQDISAFVGGTNLLDGYGFVLHPFSKVMVFKGDVFGARPHFRYIGEFKSARVIFINSTMNMGLCD